MLKVKKNQSNAHCLANLRLEKGDNRDKSVNKKKQHVDKLSITLAIIFSLFWISLSLDMFSFSARAEAETAISISTRFSGKPLLGGEATVTITVTNTGNARGYDLSLTKIFSSSRPEPEGKVSFVSARNQDGAIHPSSIHMDPLNGNLIVNFDNFTDLEPTESMVFYITVSLAEDMNWQVGDLVAGKVTARVNPMPDGSGEWVKEIATGSAEVIPITIVNQSAQHSTGVEQATGTLDRVS